MTDAVVVPGAPVLLPEYRSSNDPVPALRASAEAAVRWLGARHPRRVVVLGAGLETADAARGVVHPASLRVARSLLAVAGFAGRVEEQAPPGDATSAVTDAGLLVVADGTACREPEAPGRLDPRAAGFDEAVEVALRRGDAGALRGLDEELARALLCSGVPALRALGRNCTPCGAHVDYTGHPFGVQYWVVRWSGDRGDLSS